MKIFINGIQEHSWDLHLQDWVECRDGHHLTSDIKYRYVGPNNTNYEYYKYLGIIHLRAQSAANENDLYELRIMTATRKSPNNAWPIICLIIDKNGFENIEEFNKDGNSKSGKYKLHLEHLYLERGDYVVTTSGSIGIFANNWYQFVSLDKDGKEHLSLYGNGTAYRLATEDEKNLLNEMLWANNKKWNPNEFKIEDI